MRPVRLVTRYPSIRREHTGPATRLGADRAAPLAPYAPQRVRVTAWALRLKAVRESIGGSANSSLLHGVGDVLSGRSQEQVSGIHTPAVVASVTDEQAVLDWPERKLPRTAVGEHLSGVSPRQMNLSIARLVPVSLPLPARISLRYVDFLPKAIRQRAALRVHDLSLTEKESL